MPKVTILMPVYNAVPYLAKAIESIINQTFNDFEFLIFNDGSTDNSADIIRSYTDRRIVFFDNNQNQGYVYHLNRGIEIAKGEYIARMDADDISLPTRLKEQVDLMDYNLNIGVCGTWFKFIDSSYIVKHPKDDSQIRLALLNNCVIGHPTVMLRADLLRRFSLRYDSSFVPAEDYLMWIKLAQYCKLANLSKVLLEYRIHSNQISSTRKYDQEKKAQLVRNYQIEMLLNRSLTETEIYYHSILFHPSPKIDIQLINNLQSWINIIIFYNKKLRLYPELELLYLLEKRLGSVIKHILINQFIKILIDLFMRG